jgi:hypothetical protein
MVREFTGAPRPVSDSAPAMDRTEYLAERNAKLALSDRQGEFLDKSLLTLSGGALGLALAFLHDHNSKTDYSCFSYLGIAAFIVSLLAVLGSLYFSQHSISVHVDALDTWNNHGFVQREEFSKPVYENRWAAVTNKLNYIAGAAFLIGVINLSAFVVTNLHPST